MMSILPESTDIISARSLFRFAILVCLVGLCAREFLRCELCLRQPANFTPQMGDGVLCIMLSGGRPGRCGVFCTI